ncbi:hypothetical protein O181_116813 [Austropuccinia psidii MF-1]|uniref:Tf2-1-like SH3-like domain-containing protein n=1 Tax=Austropuccinia psidii MF-1 TaxID=1389203 RepID=A0A9Q3PWX4_9BASI|nr:hypothetical protein [Austropuccinia psidii MF-1]
MWSYLKGSQHSLEYAKDKWNMSHATPEFKGGDWVLLFTNNFNKIKECRKLKESFEGPFVIKALHGENSFEVELSEYLSNKQPTFPESLIKPYKAGDDEKFPSKNKVLQNIPLKERK